MSFFSKASIPFEEQQKQYTDTMAQETVVEGKYTLRLACFVW